MFIVRVQAIFEWYEYCESKHLVNKIITRYVLGNLILSVFYFYLTSM